MNHKSIITRDARLSVRVPIALKVAVERHAVKDRQTVADTVIVLLEEAMQQRAARRASDKRQVKTR